MDQSIKERLALLQKGDIPQGYRKTKAGIMPIDWDKIPLEPKMYSEITLIKSIMVNWKF